MSRLTMFFALEPDDDEGHSYSASLIGMETISGQGKTPAEALRALADSYQGVVDTFFALKRELPEVMR